MATKKEELSKAIMKKAKTKDNKKQISCKVALNLANTLGVSPKTIGNACNDLGIKIQNCQLGCF